MTSSSRTPFTTIRTEGALLPVDLLQRIVAGDPGLGGLDPDSYHLAGNEKLNEAINRAWTRLLGAWTAFQTSRSRLGEGDAGTTLTRERWLMPLFQELGYGRLAVAKTVTLEGKEYRLSHTWDDFPIHLVGCGVNLDRRQPGMTGAAKSSPHSLVQEYLNRNPNQLWGMLSNGLILRVLRDNASLTRQAYLEFDLEAMLTGEVYADFVVLWLICHQSRVEFQEGKPETCWLEVWSKAAQEQGTRALDKLRGGVEEAISALGSGFVANPANTALKAKLRSGELTRESFYRQLLRLVYRLIFLFAAEDRELLLDPKASPSARERYMKYYSATHLRELAEQSRGGKHPDLYATLRLVAAMLGGREKSGAGSKGLGLPVLGSFLFSAEALPDLESAELSNAALLSAVRGLAFIVDGNTRRAVDYRNLGTRELGSVYESLLELHPVINIEAGTFELLIAAGNERKTTGSYYTAEDLIKVLLDSALDPVILQAIQRAGPSIEAQIAALLALKICDPACGSGHFLIAAARRIARRLAQLRSGDEEPSPDTIRTALREAIQHCIYGVDINAMSVELCKVNLWLESIEPGKPLSFLDAHIQCGDSLVGVAPGLDISEIPDEAFNPAFGDDKATASALKKRNKAERAGQMGLGFYAVQDDGSLQDWIAKQSESLEQLPEETAEQVGQKAQSYQEYVTSPQYRRKKLEYDLWTAAFFWKMETKPGASGILAPTQEMLRHHRAGGMLPAELVRRVEKLAEQLNFMHWELRFPKVFTGNNMGFDCMLGNPPWERIKLQEEEFFAQRDIEIAIAQNKAARQKIIDNLSVNNPTLAYSFWEAKHYADAASKFMRLSSRYPLTGMGDVNTYALFSETFSIMISQKGRAGFIVPSGLATDNTTKVFFGDLISNQRLESLFEFENEGFFESAGQGHMIRFALTTIVGVEHQVKETQFLFQGKQLTDLNNVNRAFTLSSSDISLVNPNTKTCPIFQNRRDAEITKSIYLRVPVLIREAESDTEVNNPWGIRFMRMFDMANDSSLFRTEIQLRTGSFRLEGNIYDNNTRYVPLYEAKMVYHYNHRHGNFHDSLEGQRSHVLPTIADCKLQDPCFLTFPFYWVPEFEVKKLLHEKDWQRKWLIGWRDVTDARASARTLNSAMIPWAGATDGFLLMLPTEKAPKIAALLGNLSSLVCDYIARQKVGGLHMKYFTMKQIPVLPPSVYTNEDITFISKRVLELIYTAWDIKGFADDLWQEGDMNLCDIYNQEWEENRSVTGGNIWDPPQWAEILENGFPLPPFKWNEDRRTQLRAELDAYYARLYGLTRDQLRYILDPQDVYGPDFPGETFRVLKDKETRQYGEYRTRRLVLEAWDRLEGVEPAPVMTPAQVISAPPPTQAPAPSTTAAPKEKEKTTPDPAEEAQPMLTDFGLFKCLGCGKMVMGYDKDNHTRINHNGKAPEYKKMGS